MAFTEIRYTSARVTVRDIPDARIDTRKKWRRIQVLLNRANAQMEARMLAAMLGPWRGDSGKNAR